MAYQYNPTGIMQRNLWQPVSSYAPMTNIMGANPPPASTGAVNYYPDLPAVIAPLNTPSLVTPSTGGTLGSTVVGPYTQQFGGKPGVPSPVATAGEAVTGNLANYPDINKLIEDINATNERAVMGNVETNIPNYTGLIGQRSANIEANLAGQVPTDVQQLLRQQAAERGVAAGIPGSQAIDYSNLLSLGLTSLGRQDVGAQQLGSALTTVPHVPIADPSSMMVSPGDIQGAQYAANVIGAAPDPSAAANEAFNRLLLMRALAEQGGQGRNIPSPTPRLPTATPSIGYNWPQLGTSPTSSRYGSTAWDTTPDISGEGLSVYQSPFEMSFPDLYGGEATAPGTPGFVGPTTPFYDQTYSPDYLGGWYNVGEPATPSYGDYYDFGF